VSDDGCEKGGGPDSSKSAGPRTVWSNKKLTRRYNAKRQVFERLEREATFVLRAECEPYGDRVYSVKSRIKTLDSVARKAERKLLTEPLDMMYDIVGLRVVCLYRSDLDEFRKTIEESFEVLEVDDKAGD
jgi:putative GTP pyrophosphokinase